jgi:hypothetical protein
MQILAALVLLGLGFLIAWALGFMKGPGKGPGAGTGHPVPAATAPAQPPAPPQPTSPEPELRIGANGLEWQGKTTPFDGAEKLLAAIRPTLDGKKLRIVFTGEADYLEEESVRKAIRDSGISHSLTETKAP